tara:strand:- start:3507 stop:3866 length:360 start_codon:yes stop_codon:yes gene_type:complete
MSRKRFTEKQVIEALIRTGHKIYCFRTRELITLETVGQLEREHPVPLALGGADDPTNAAYSLKSAHKIQTNGKPATSCGSDKHAIAKVRRILADKPSRHPMQKSRRPIPSRKFAKRVSK